MIVAVIVRAARRTGTVCEPEQTIARIEAALMVRRGRPTEPRGASRRIKDPTEAEARLAFVQLKKLALRDRSRTAAAAALYLLVEPRIGFRPRELCGATVEGVILTIPNSKLADGQDRWRHHDLKRFPAAVIEAIRLLVDLAPAPGDPQAFVLWRNSLAASLARASLTAGGRRLAPYAFRHIAIATWEKSGFSAEEIAALAGHLSTRTARAHYARAGSGWNLAELPEPMVVARPTDAASTEPVTHDHGNAPSAVSVSADRLLDFEPMPEPGDRRVAAKGQPDHASEWFKAHNARIEEMKRRLADGHSREPRDVPDSDPADRANRRF